MKILIISRYCTLPSWQGSAKHTQSFASALLTQGHYVELISGEDVEKYEVILQEGYKVHRIPLPKTKGKLEHLTASAIREKSFFQLAEEIFNEFNPDVIHVGVFGKMGPFIEVAKRKRYPITAMVHDYTWLCLSKFLLDYQNKPCSGPESFEKCYNCAINQLSLKRRSIIRFVDTFPFIKKCIPKRFLPKIEAQNQIRSTLSYYSELLLNIDLLLVQNYDSEEFYKKSGVEGSKIIFVPQGLIEEKLKLKEKKPNNDKFLNIGYIGRISREKGIDILINALAKFGNKKGLKLSIISDGVTKEEIKRVIGKFPIGLNIDLRYNIGSDVKFTEEIAQLDLFVASSTCRETGPRTIMEAIAQKVPCVVSDVVGNKYLIKDGVSGKIFKAGDVDELYNILKEIKNNPSMLEVWKENLPKLISEEERTKALINIHENLNQNII